MVDIENHEESLRELAKTSLVNNLTLVLCWSAKEAARYVELYKSFENASSSAIRSVQGQGYAERMVEFVTTPRSVNKADAVGLVGAFGSVRAAVNAAPEEVAGLGGWGEKKVERWCGSVREGFRVRRAVKRGGEEGRKDGLLNDREGGGSQIARVAVQQAIPIGRLPSREVSGLGQVRSNGTPDAERRPPKRLVEDVQAWEPGDDEEEALLLAAAEEVRASTTPRDQERATTAAGGVTKRLRPTEPDLSEGMKAALAKLRQT